MMIYVSIESYYAMYIMHDASLFIYDVMHNYVLLSWVMRC
jgi:hypothetical protein